ncbi:DNA-binding Lrp family transcriptional regulator [Paenarthrobacter nicotinovorans]|uniref:DNA-binding Lrp family transcriptional regulator n=1 Tax=Paenarthrobacter nicotinovorans TaxID=29320 RepID=A0ABT9TN85_PAENI|nr:Lrp/AsnC family transcriptional regulator [Paenarthrobacter nicotinovorans]MDQ0103143.1 DNA-binding Lrp family transcriptional regulator [Paenarthrobacter nicotinovorans]
MDDVDRRILDELLLDGRISRQDLARKTGLSRVVVARRLTALLVESGARVIGLVHPTVLGQTVMAHVAIEVNGPAEPIGKRIAGDERIPFVSITLGASALVAEIRVRSQEDLFQSISRIRDLPGVASTATSTYTELLVDVLAQTTPTSHASDAVDLALIESLRQDGRASFATMAATAGVSTGTARSRVLKLLETGVVRIGVIWDPDSQDGQVRVGLGLRVRGSAAGVAERLAKIPEITFLATSIGQYDLLATLDGSTSAAAIAALNEVRQLPQVVQCTTWAHLQVIKEKH